MLTYTLELHWAPGVQPSPGTARNTILQHTSAAPERALGEAHGLWDDAVAKLNPPPVGYRLIRSDGVTIHTGP